MPRMQTDDDRGSAQRENHQTLNQWLNSPRFREGMARILPKQLESERFHSLVLRQLSVNPKLAECTPLSIVGGMMHLASLGLEPGINGEGWLVPYENSKKDADGKWFKVLEAAVQIGYLGHLALAWRSEKVSDVQCNYVMQGDYFKHRHGTEGMIEHVPADNRPVDPKLMTHAYGIVGTIYGGHIWWVLNRNEVERIRQSSPSRNSPAWQDWYMEMAMGKALKRALKFAPKTREMATAITLDDEHDAGVPQAFDFDIPGNLLPDGLDQTDAQRAAAELLKQARRGKAQATVPDDLEPEADGAQDDEPPPPGDEDEPPMTIPPKDQQREREPVMAGSERAANRKAAAAAPAKAKAAPEPEPEPKRAPDSPEPGGMGW